MKDEAKTKKQLINELQELRRQIAEMESSSPGDNSINVSNINIEWEPEHGNCTFQGLPVAMMWIDTTLAGLMSGVQSMVGTKRFGLALQSEGRKSVEADWQVISQFQNFRDGFRAISNIAAVAGWGEWEIVSFNEDEKEVSFRVRNSWEGRYQKALGVCWGSGMVAGKMAGYCSKLFNTNCWAEQRAFIAKGDEYDEFLVHPSVRLIEKEIEGLLATDEATRADMAVALKKLQTEIAERKKVEEALSDSEKKYRNLIESTTDWIWSCDLEGRHTFSNSAIKEILGYEPRELVGQPAFQLMHPDDRESVLGWYEDCVNKKQGWNMDHIRWLHRDGTVRFLESKAEPILDAEGLLVGFSGIDRDITDRKRAEAEHTRLIAILENTSDMVSTSTPDALLTYMNSAGRRMVGWEDDESLVDKRIPDVHPRWAMDIIEKDGIPAAISDGIWVGQTALLHRNGTEVPVSQVILSHRSASGELEYLSTIMRDITDRKRAEEALLKAREELEQRVEERTAQLAESNRKLREEIIERQEAQEQLALFHQFVEASGEGMGWADLEGRVRYMNPTLIKMVGEDKPEDIYGKPVLEYYSKENQKRLMEEIFPYVLEKGTWTGEMDLLSRKGKVTPATHSLFYLLDNEGNPLCFANVLTDLTERRRAEEALRKAHAELEIRVEERTAELKATNKLLMREIEERKLAESELSKSERFLESVFDSIQDGISVLDEELNILRVNKIIKNWYAHMLPLEGKKCHAVYQGLNEPCKPCPSLRALRTGSLEMDEVPLIREDGAKGTLELYAFPMLDDTGRATGVVEYVRDVTKRKRAEEALRESEERYKSLFKNNHSVMLLIDPETAAIVDANPAACSFYGYGLEELTKKKITDINILSEEQVFHEIEQAKSEERSHFYFRHRPKDGKVRDVEVYSGPITVNGRNLLYSIIHDITARKQAEEALNKEALRRRTLMDRSRDGIAIIDQEHRVVEANPRFAEMLGYTSEEVLGLHTWDWEAAMTEKEIRANFADITKTDAIFETRHRRKDGKIFDAEVSASGAMVDDTPMVFTISRDITDRKRAEEALRESEERFALFMSHLPSVVFMKDLDGRYVYVNEAYEQHRGLKEEECLGKTDYDLWPPEDADRFRRMDQLVMSEGRSREVIESITYADGEIHTQITYKFPVLIGGKSAYLAGIGIDITDRKLAEEQLKEHKEILENILSASPEGIALAEDRVIRWTNDAWKTIFGFESKEDYLGKSTEIIYPTREEYDRVGQVLYSQLKEAKIPQMDLKFKRKDGSMFDGHMRLSSLDPSDPLKRVIATVTDISWRKEAEEALRKSEERFRSLYKESKEKEQLYESLLNSAPDAVAIYNLEGETQYVNPAFTQIFGYTHNDVKDKRIPFVPESEADKTLECIKKVLGGDPISGFETKRFTKDGRLLNVSLSSSVYQDHEGRPSGIVVFLRDVTMAKQLEKQLLHSQKMEAIGTLAGGIAHDFNNLLQGVQGYSELLLLSTKRDEPGYDDLQEIIQAAKRGSELTKQLLTFSRKVESKLRPINLNYEVQQTKRLLARTLPKMIKIKLKLAEDLKKVDADPAQIEQVLMNLALNAGDAMLEGGRLTIETRNATFDDDLIAVVPEATPGDYVVVMVSDSGHGIEKETLERIFDPFFTTKEMGKGTGLGLSMVYGIVENHGGHIACYSEPGEGTTFKIYLPAIKAMDELPEEEVLQEFPGGNETILLADDEAFIRKLGRKILSKFGYTVFTASDGESALELYRQNKGDIDLVILDLIMPGMGGKRCLEELLKFEPQVKVIIASGFSAEGPARDAVKSGAKGFIGKPFEVGGMLKVVRDVLDED